MKRRSCNPEGCSCQRASLGGIEATDFAALDGLAVKLVCIDSSFAAPVRQMGRVLGRRIASERDQEAVSLEAALSTLVSACGLEGVIESRFIERNAEGARLQIAGCDAAGCAIPQVGRAVCGFDAGLFEGFLSGATGKAWDVEETTCISLGNSVCEFLIHPALVSGGGEREGVAHG